MEEQPLEKYIFLGSVQAEKLDVGAAAELIEEARAEGGSSGGDVGGHSLGEIKVVE